MADKPKFPPIEKFQLEVTENIHHTPWVWLPRFKRTDGKPLKFLAGQWVLTRVEKNGEDIRRAYSVASHRTFRTTSNSVSRRWRTVTCLRS